MEAKELLLKNIDRLHTTNLGMDRIRRNLNLTFEDVIEYCIDKVQDKRAIISKRGKNFYVEIDNVIITINSYSYMIITAHLLK